MSLQFIWIDPRSQVAVVHVVSSKSACLCIKGGSHVLSDVVQKGASAIDVTSVD